MFEVEMNHRKYKKMLRRMGMSEMHVAFLAGENQCMDGKEYKNPYPAGYRHNEFKRGYNLFDPCEQHYGRNV